MAERRVRLRWSEGTVSGAWHVPDGGASSTLVVSHGAGKDMDDPLLVGLGDRLSGAGVAVLRFNLPYREAGRSAPGPQRVSERCFRDVLEGLDAPAFCGGKSYGGRIASHVVADGAPASGLVFLGYPLHPPGKPEQLRDAHLGSVGRPMLFVQGARDPFATPDLLDATVTRLPGAELHRVDAGDHSLKVRRRPYDDVVDEVAQAVVAFLARQAP